MCGNNKMEPEIKREYLKKLNKIENRFIFSLLFLVLLYN